MWNIIVIFKGSYIWNGTYVLTDDITIKWMLCLSITDTRSNMYQQRIGKIHKTDVWALLVSLLLYIDTYNQSLTCFSQRLEEKKKKKVTFISMLKYVAKHFMVRLTFTFQIICSYYHIYNCTPHLRVADTVDHFEHASDELPYFVCAVQNKWTSMLSCSTFIEERYGWHLEGRYWQWVKN